MKLTAQDKALLYDSLLYYSVGARLTCRKAIQKLLVKMGNPRLAKKVYHSAINSQFDTEKRM